MCDSDSKLLRSSHDRHGFSSYTQSHSQQLSSVKSADCLYRGNIPHVSIIHVRDVQGKPFNKITEKTNVYACVKLVSMIIKPCMSLLL